MTLSSKWVWRLAAAAVALLVSSCRQAQDSELLSLSVKHGSFTVRIPAFGELQSVAPTPLVTPPQLRGRQTITWLAADNSLVKQGDLVVKLNSTTYLEQIKVEEANIAKINLEISQKESQLRKEKSDLQGQIGVTAIEKKIADNYSARDETIYSRNKIIEDAIDLDYLKEKEKHYQKKGTKIEQKVKAELQLLSSKKSAIQTKLNQYNDILKSLDITAPHDGLFVVEKLWNGEKYRIGMDVWSGEKIGTLPDLNQMEAKVFVLESEASGLKEKLPVSLVIDFEPGKTFSGYVHGIDTIAKPLDEKSPLKYFEVKVSLDKTDVNVMKPGVQVKATIAVAAQENVICVPNQALFFEQGKPYLNILSGHRLKKRPVEIGLRSLTQTVINKGLADGDKVLLGNPQAEK